MGREREGGDSGMGNKEMHREDGKCTVVGMEKDGPTDRVTYRGGSKLKRSL